jgi:hypothetical protein
MNTGLKVLFQLLLCTLLQYRPDRLRLVYVMIPLWFWLVSQTAYVVMDLVDRMKENIRVQRKRHNFDIRRRHISVE